MRHKWDAWARSPIAAGQLTFIRPDRVLEIQGWPAGVDKRRFRESLKDIDPFLDVMVQMPQCNVIILQMDTDPPTRLWSSMQLSTKGWIVFEVGQRVLDTVHRATWMTRKDREREIEQERLARAKSQWGEIDDISRDAKNILDVHPGRIWSLPRSLVVPR